MVSRTVRWLRARPRPPFRVGRAGRSPVAPWIRTRLRVAPGAACALALLVALTTCLAAAFPRAVDRYEDAGLRHSFEQAHPDRTTVQLYAPLPIYGSPEQAADALRPGTLAEQYAKIRTTVRRPLVTDPAQSTYGVSTTIPLAVLDPWLPQPNGLPARLVFAAQHGLAAHAGLRTGRLPRAPAASVTAATTEVEAAVTAETATTLHIKVGSVVHVPSPGRAPLTVRVTGIVSPRTPDGAYWATQPLLRAPALARTPGGGPDDAYWLGALLLAPEAAPALLGIAAQARPYWQLAPDPAALHSRDLDALKQALAALESGPGLQKVRGFTNPLADVSTGLDDVLASYTRLRTGVAPLVSVAAFGTGTVAVVVLVLAGGLAADRRRAELALLRARGTSLPGLTARLLGETAVVALPAGALGLTAALLLLPGGRDTPALAAALTVTAVACAALPVRAAAAHRSAHFPDGREDVASVRPSRRRTVTELTLLALAAGAVETLRRQGTSGDVGSSGGQLISLAPVLVGVVAALLLVRLYPLPLRRLARPAGRLRGAVGHLSLARAGRTSVSAALPLLALLTALTTAAFGGSVLVGVHDARDRAALLAVGADARIESTTGPLASALPDHIRHASGVHGLTEVSIDYTAEPEDGRQSVPLAGVDPKSYAALTGRTGYGAFGAGELRRGGGAGDSVAPLPALASPTVAETYGTGPFPVRLADGTTVTVRIALTRDRTPAVPGSDFLVVDRAGLGRGAARPTALLVTGDHLDGKALRKAAEGAGAAGASASVQLRSEERARYVDSPLQSGAERVYTAAVAAGAGYATLALLLTLLRAAPERAALLARLRTMGLTRSQGRRLLILESLPQAALAAAGGTLTGWATVRLLSPGIDLTTIALATAQSPAGSPELRTDPLSLVVPALSVLVVAVGVAAGQAWWTGRRGSITELRAGDSR
ncbi:FtsX-like permease family protein [Streptomyces sp. NPDC002928]|uniref:FtsX-like permease family protein n=1 Tax=Streptomyces sp. NPDC002928 TaxID=3154440 RepID=UPI0033B307BD